ncbi:MAG: NAD-dependent epimerase/dehydratase family protein [candidate division WOR-3 bacterium]
MISAVTGANGFIGSNLVRGLLRERQQVRALVRTGRDLGALDGLKCEVIQLDYSDASSLRSVLTGVEVLFHLAARTRDYGTRREFQKINLGLTQAIAHAAVNAGVRRFVFTSSAVLYGCGARCNLRECDVSLHLKFPYARTKLQAEQYLLGLSGIEVVITRPGDVFGPGDRLVTWPFLDAIRRGRLAYVNSGQALLCYTYIDNLVQGLILAAGRGRTREIYNLTDGTRISLRTLAEKTAQALGVPAPKYSVPFCLAYPAAALLERLYLILDLDDPPLTRYRVLRACNDCHLSIEKAQQELGYRPETDLEKQIAAMVGWYLKETARQA